MNNRYKRIFTFGCSFTSWAYPTWADILIKEFAENGLEGYNYGQGGAGNLYILTKLMEANSVYKFTEEDLVIIEWTSMAREDRFAANQWHTPGSIYNQTIYNDKFIEKWADPQFYTLRDSALITMANYSFPSLKAKFYTLAMRDFKLIDDSYLDETSPTNLQILERYKLSESLSFPPIMNALNLIERTPEAFSKRPVIKLKKHDKEGIIEWHPLPGEHYQYLKEHMLPVIGIELSHSTEEFVKFWSDKVNNNSKDLSFDEIGWKEHKKYLNHSLFYERQ